MLLVLEIKLWGSCMIAIIQKASRRISNVAHELFFGVSTRGQAPAENEGGVHYATRDYNEIKKVLRELGLLPTDVFVDIGSGKGRVLCIVARMRLTRAIGVEYSPSLSEVARKNIDSLRGKQTPVEVHTMAAEDYDYSAATVLYLFNPFEAYILEIVLRKVFRDRSSSPIRIVFENESPAQRAVFASQTWLDCKRRWMGNGGIATSFYSNR